MLKRLNVVVLFFILISLTTSKVKGQDHTNRIGVTLPFSVFITENANLSLDDIRESQAAFFHRDSIPQKTKPANIYWLRIDLIDELPQLQLDSIWYLRFNSLEYASIFYQVNNTIVEEKFGVFEKEKTSDSKLYSSGVAFNINSLIDGRYLYLKVQRVTYIDSFSRWKVSYGTKFQNDLILQFYSSYDLNKLIPVYIFSGICLVIFILTLAFFLYSRRLEFLFYTLYVLFLFFYLSADIMQLHEVFFGTYSLISYTFFQAAQVIINLFYILFVMYYLNSKVDYPKLHIGLKAIAYLLMAIILLEAYFLLTSSFLANIYILDFQRIIMTLFGVVGMTYLLVKTKDKLGYFIVCGSFLYMVGALALLFYQVRLYMILGSSLEILIFASGLTYKIQQEYIEKMKFQKEALINENRALRAQMNPHFIFNSLSSIQHLITSNKKEAAVKYLNKFSLLMRNLLESSIEINVILSEEISALEKYLELEALRFNDSFKYEITVADNLDPDSVEVPALLVQPFVENAILHGLLNKIGEDKRLTLHFNKEEDTIVCEIEDNGIGRQASASNQTILKSSKKSRGIEVTQKRLELLNHSDKNSIEFIDKKDNEGRPAGTLVRIKIAIE